MCCGMGISAGIGSSSVLQEKSIPTATNAVRKLKYLDIVLFMFGLHFTAG
jgi:hypothetical protein